ncbi:MAG: ArsR family transcriptional regulator, partial [Oscillospiraceae bacterium]|nr:ArsR family transcriptional regulator [Oscillospiraceae bacterium]
FCQLTDTCAYTSLQKDWREYGAKSFCFEVLEQLTQKETQTQQEFKADIKILEDIWKEKLSEHDLY